MCGSTGRCRPVSGTRPSGPFDKAPSIRAMLASLQAAGVGINLIEASTVILAESCTPAPFFCFAGYSCQPRLGWAPARILDQAHITKVYRLVVKGAVEE